MLTHSYTPGAGNAYLDPRPYEEMLRRRVGGAPSAAEFLSGQVSRTSGHNCPRAKSNGTVYSEAELLEAILAVLQFLRTNRDVPLGLADLARRVRGKGK